MQRVDAMSAAPGSLFKYQPFNAQTLANLNRRAVYVSSPQRFNDPFDCNVEFISDQIRPETLGSARAAIERLALEQGKETIVQQLRDATEEQLREVLLNAAKNALSEHRNGFLRERGVTCFGSTPDNLLMWGHYADGHRGFCLELDATKPPLSEAYRVGYTDVFPRLDVVDLLTAPDFEALFRAMVLTKARCWEYEEEWRLLHQDAGSLFGYGWNNLKAIYFGTEMEHNHREILATMVHGSPTQLWIMSKQESRFGVEGQAVTFKPASYEKTGPTEETPK